MAKTNKVVPSWQAESDAYSLVGVQEIMDDKERYKRALKKVEEIKKDAQKRLSAADKIVNKQSSKKGK